jgi:ATP phosphoribosyltransferase
MQYPGTYSARLSLPSKGRLFDDCLAFLSGCGLSVYRPNPRQYEATIPALPGLQVLFQRPADIVTSVRDGSVDFGISGLDVIEERRGGEGEVLILHEALNFGHCSLCVAVPEAWQEVRCVDDLRGRIRALGRPLRVASRYPVLTSRFLDGRGVAHTVITAEGTLETAPSIGYADLITDVVSSGQTLRDNRLVPLPDGVMIVSQAALIANTRSLKRNPETQRYARYLLEFFEAHLRAEDSLSIFANMRGESPEAIAQRIFASCSVQGLQGPTISQVVVREAESGWWAVNMIVPRRQLFQTITELRAIGGSGVVVVPVKYIFDEEPPRYKAMLDAIRESR